MFTMIAASYLVLSNPAQEIRPPQAPFQITGTYFFQDGDLLVWDCNQREPCVDMLVRDDRLSRDAANLAGVILTLRVQRVSSCGPRSSQAVCLRGADGSALRILEWLSVGERR